MFLLAILFLLSACSTKKNTSATRFYHATTARFNTLYNGQVAFQEGMYAQSRGHKEDYTQLLPMYLSTNKKTAGLGKSNYETAITKCEKAIKVHSIKKRPTVSHNKKRTPELKEYLARKEFNPYLYKAWLMMAEAQFRKGEFIEAASTYNYILRLYSTQPAITSVAKARLARCYVALEWAYDAEDVLSKMKRDSTSRLGERERENTMAAYHILNQQYVEAIPYLAKTIPHVKGKQARARLHFLLGQLYRETGQNEMAYKALSKVIRANPPYEMSFNARILQTEVMSGGKYSQMISRLKRMAKSDKNKNYLDKVYYAMGNIYMSVNDTARCIGAWEKGVKEGTQNGSDKAVLLLHLSQLYWQMENYIDAARTYQQCVSILDKEHDEYEESARRSKILTELEPHLSTIKLQDSLQALAKMTEPEYIAAIDRVIEELKKKEKEEEKLAARQGRTAANRAANPSPAAQAAANKTAQRTTATAPSNQQRGAWYFYNPNTVKQGIQEFQRRWGKRKNEDYWRTASKAGISTTDGSTPTDSGTDTLPTDSTMAVADSTVSAEQQALNDSLANDPHHREYYLKQIPFTEEQLEASNQLLSDGLYNAGILEQEKLENFPLAEQTMLRLLTDFPDRTDLDNIYYHMFLLYGRLQDVERAETYRTLLLQEYPDSKYAVLLGNPNYEHISRHGVHMEDSLYADAYEAYLAEDYARVEENYQYSTANFPKGANRARLMFIRAMSMLYSGQQDSFMVTLKDVIQQYPKEEITELANAINQGIEEGRPLMSGRLDAGDIWSRHTRLSTDSTEVQDTLDANRYSNFAFVLAYPTDSLNEEHLLFEMARYNFTSYMVRNFDIEITEQHGISMMVIKGFLSYDEVHAYAQQLYQDQRMSVLLRGIRTLLISEDNLKLIGTRYSFDEYKEFYDRELVPLEVPEDLQIDEPTDIEVIDPDDVVPEEERVTEEEVIEVEDDFPFGF